MVTLRTDAQLLHVSSDEIAQHVSWDLAIEAARATSAADADGHIQVERTRLNFDGGWMRLLAASISSLGVFGYKEFHLTGDGSVRYCVHLFDAKSGRPIGIVDAALITTMRTAATAAVAVEHIVGAGAPVRLGVVGSGAEAQAGVAALAKLLELESVAVTSRRPENRDAFVAALEPQVGITVHPFATVKEALAEADVAYVATNSGGNVVLWLSDVVDLPVLASIGSTLPVQRELDGEILATADRVIVDTLEVFHESGDALEAVEHGMDPRRATLLGDALRSDITPDRSRRTVYKSIGSPGQDIVLASMILEAAERVGFGRRVTPLSSVKVNL
jgi:alanine dehydrogenase